MRESKQGATLLPKKAKPALPFCFAKKRDLPVDPLEALRGPFHGDPAGQLRSLLDMGQNPHPTVLLR
jgi:hypothetical protein